MSHSCKYIIVDTGQVVVPILFSDVVAHTEIANKVGGQVLSAGFCSVSINEQLQPRYVCWGKSVSLGVSSREQDNDILNRYLGLID